MKLYSILFFAVLSSVGYSASTPTWDAAKNLSSCRVFLGGNVAPKTAPDSLMSKVQHATRTAVALPYYMTKAYNTQLLPISLPGRTKVAFKTYLGYSKAQEIIPVYGQVESWHALTRVLDGYHMTFGFKSAEDRAEYLKATHYYAHITEGTIDLANGKKEYLVALTFDQFETLQVAYPNLFGIKPAVYLVDRPPIDVQVKPSTPSELQRLSSEVIQGPRGRGAYYFNGSDAVGYRTEDNQYFRIYVTQNGKPLGANIASHAEIVKRQMAAQGIVLDVAAMRNPKNQLHASRRLLDKSLALLKIAIEKPWIGPTVLNIEGHSLSARSLIAEQKFKSAELNESLAALARDRFLLTSSRLKQARNFNSPMEDLPKLQKGLTTYKTGEPNSTRTLTFVGIKSEFLEDNLYAVHGELLHDNIGRTVLGDFFDDPNVLKHHIIGGNVQIHYNEQGKAARFTLLKNSILVTAGERKMSRLEIQTLQGLLNDFINRPE